MTSGQLTTRYNMIRSIVQAYRTAYYGLPREIWIISGALFVNRFGTMVLPFLSLYLVESLGYSAFSAGAMVSVYGIGSVFGTYMGGRLVARVGAIRLQVILLLLAVPMYLLIPRLSDWVSIAVGLYFLSLFCEGVRPANATAIAQFSPPELQTRSFALQRMALNLGVSFGPAIGGMLATVSFAWLFWVDAGTTLLCAVCLSTLLRRSRHIRSTAKQLATELEIENDRAETDAESSKGDEQQLVGPASDPMYICFLALILLTSLVFFQFHATYPIYLRDVYGMTKPQIGRLYAVNTIIIVIFEMVLVERIRNWSMIRVIGWGNALSCLGFGLLPFGTTATMAILSMLVLTLGEMLSMPIASGWIAQRSAGKDQGRYMGWYSTTYSIAFVIAPLLGMAAYDTDRHLCWYVSAVIGVVVLAGSYVLAWSLEKTTTDSTVA